MSGDPQVRECYNNLALVMALWDISHAKKNEVAPWGGAELPLNVGNRKWDKSQGIVFPSSY